VQNPAYPQSLNRYSYVFNNPLKYIDPLGHWVLFICNEHYQDILDAWEAFKELYPYWAELMETSDHVFTIGHADLSGIDALGSTIPAIKPFKDEGRWNFNIGTHIRLDFDLMQVDIEGISGVLWVLAHEIVHAIGDMMYPDCWNSMYEEAVAMQFQNSIARRIGYQPSTHNMKKAYKKVMSALTVDLESIRENEAYFPQIVTALWDAFKWHSSLADLYALPICGDLRCTEHYMHFLRHKFILWY